MKHLILAAVLSGAVIANAHAGELYASCTIHGGIVLCFLTPEPMAVADGVCDRAMRAQVIAQEYASANPDKPAIIAKIMGVATDNLFKQCAWHAPRAVTAPAAFKPAG